MLESLSFTGVGPASELALTFKERVNFLTGDNGLGKTFVLDAAWWALTNTWAGQELLPQPPPVDPSIVFRYTNTQGVLAEETGWFYRQNQSWSHGPEEYGFVPKNNRAKQLAHCLVVYVQSDGGFAVRDPVRNLSEVNDFNRLGSYVFSEDEVWGGLPLDQSIKHCNGLIADWASWQLEGGPAFDALKRVLEVLSPSPDETLVPGPLVKVSVTDARRHPTLATPYGQHVPLIHASAGIRRVLSLAYLLVWTWFEHLETVKLTGAHRASEIIFLVDEVESHLHPRWQRRIVPSLLAVMDELTGSHDVSVQLISATHAPLVLASMEPHFDERDTIWDFDLIDGRVEVREAPWRRRGDASAWLTSDIFELKQARSIEAEEAMTEAKTLLRSADSASIDSIREVDAKLRESLGDIDPFWVRWSCFVDSRTGSP